ncbi:hypothetical protein CKM354_001288600 [Cercospora kikuchii]|uniref:Catechol 1,2-dioxygenase n=1 Tax=Cercospora kikuchii TaxID=84275 RepID=A0A9P3FMV1_9PEZI|nr:uncharacterized protein CKM354_001288600 [Cercospora kikuchii]GIZ49868.1 hypothetical protein CKM354_001288600 [Cercospora kikuchii]
MSSTKNTALYDPDFTNNVIAATGPNASARLKEVMPALIRHVHDFAREVNLTTEEYMAGIAMINWAGQMSNDRRNEGQLLTDVIGLETLVDEIAYKSATAAASSATPSAILGPFWRHDAPQRTNGDSIIRTRPADGQISYMYGRVKDAATGKPIDGATLDVWQASTNGLYEQQDAEQEPHNLRGVFTTGSDGSYAFYCLRPTPYPVPGDGPAGKLLDLLDRHHYRPGHIHLILKADGYKSITTQIFDKKTPYLNNDSVFAVKAGLCIDFLPRIGDEGAEWETKYDIAMAAL